MSKNRRSVRLAVFDDSEAVVLRTALEVALASAEPMCAREALARWLRQLSDAQPPDAENVLNLDGSPHESTAVERVFAHWQRVMNKSGARLDSKRARLLRRRIAEYGEQVLLQAIDGCACSAWHMGDNDEGRRYNDLALVLRDASHIESFCELAERPPSMRAVRSKFGAAGRDAQARAELDAFKRGSDE